MKVDFRLCFVHTLTLFGTDAASVRTSYGWLPLTFDHDDDNFSSSLGVLKSHRTLRCQRTDTLWPRVLLPTSYHGPCIEYPQYGSLGGSLPTFLALMALSIKPDELKEAIPRLRINGKWQSPEYQKKSMF
jgi:hypothetical protein